MPAESISKYNATWGICGFTSALTHLYASDVRLRDRIDTKTPHAIRLGLLIEVLTFLKYVCAFRTDLLPDLEALNRRLDSPVMRLGAATFMIFADQFVRQQGTIGDSNRFQCALTPEALTLYLQVICAIQTATLTADADPGGQGVLGIMNSKNELVHWVYRDVAGKVYNWGKVMSPSEWLIDAEDGLGNPGLHHVGCHVSVV